MVDNLQNMLIQLWFNSPTSSINDLCGKINQRSQGY
jgi:hypothetical protein